MPTLLVLVDGLVIGGIVGASGVSRLRVDLTRQLGRPAPGAVHDGRDRRDFWHYSRPAHPPDTPARR
jgi:hypothetical protein